MTKQRELILRIVQSSWHFTAEQVFLAAKQELPSIAVGTVYNNLNALCADGTITRVRLSGQPDHFDRAPIEKAHHHMVCDCCGKIADVQLEDLNRYLTDRCRTKINSVELTIHHTCSDCQSRQ